MKSDSKLNSHRFYFEKSVIVKERKVFLDEFRKTLIFDPDCGPTASTLMFSYAFAKLNASLRQPGNFDPRTGFFVPHNFSSFYGCRSFSKHLCCRIEKDETFSYDSGLTLWFRMLVRLDCTQYIIQTFKN